MTTVFDHVAIAATSRDGGHAWFQQQTGIELPMGGEHPHMGTHNCVTSVGNDGFFELIAINPEADGPDGARWFGLDGFSGDPAAVAWIVGVKDIDAQTAKLRALGINVGEVLDLSRGDMSWRLTVRPDGQVPLGGTFPMMIEWPEGPHPSRNMKDVGVRIDQLTLHSTDVDLLTAGLAAIGADYLAEITAAESDRLEVALGELSL